GVEVPNFFMLVPESSRSKGGQQVSQINRLAARIVWQYEKRPDLGPLPALPATLHEDDPVIKRGEVAQQYQELVNHLQVRANALLPGELAEGKTGKERDDLLAEGRRVAEARGDLFSHGSGAQEKRGERYRPERIPFGLQQAANTQTGPGREQPARETGKAELDALHKAELDRARTEMRDMLSRKVPGFVVQRYASDVVDLLLKQFHVEALQEMQAEGWGTPPTEYAFLALGSGGRREHTSFGDLDFALVVGDTKKRAKKGEQKKTSKQYFQELGNRIAQKANGLGERGGAAQGGTEKKGLRICEGGVFPAPSGQMPYGPEVLIGTPDDLAKVQKRPGWITFNQQEFELGADAELFDALREPRFAFGSTGGEALATKYQERLTKTMGQKGSTKQTRSVESGRVAIDEALAQARSLPSAASLQQAGAVFNVKKLSRPVQLYVKGMCLCAGVTVANSRDRIQELQKKGLLQPDLARQALDAVELIATLRLRAHLDAMEQHDELKATPSDEEGGEAALSGEDLTKVQAVITILLPALGAAAQRALT
ncbi:MAG: DUF294 nucleotidyltransferase-like domain-containing protein, partial [Acidimicrobiales bacterium]